MTKRLFEPMLEGGIRHVHFFNGRRLTAEDLEAEQAANREERARLGLAAGYGIVSGFEVSLPPKSLSSNAQTAAALEVRPGTAINWLGKALTLPRRLVVELVAPENSISHRAGFFGPCETGPRVEIGTGSGAYILVASPASGFEGRAPKVGVDSDGRVTGCGSRYSVTGVKFGVVPAPLPGGVGSLATLRNRLAHHCFGTEALLTAHRNPPDGPGNDRVTDVAPGIRPSDVPLALFYWSNGSVQFVDMWSVRRRVSAPFPAPRWVSYVADTLEAVGEAVFLQFQDEINDLAGHGTGLKAVEAGDRFRFLPAAGFLPVGHNEFDVHVFFNPDRFIRQIEFEADPAYLRALLFSSFRVDPIDVNDPPPIAIYHIPEVDDFVFFMRQDASSFSQRRPGNVLELLDDEPEPQKKGALEVDLALGDVAGQERLAGQIRAGLSQSIVDVEALIHRNLKVTAVDELGNEYAGRIVIGGDVNTILTQKRFARVLFDPLDPGTYKVAVQSTLFRPASKVVDLGPGGRERVLFELLLSRPKAPGQSGLSIVPQKTVPADWMEFAWYDKMAVMEAYINPTPLPEDVRKWDLVTDPPGEVKEWLSSWADAVAARYPNAPVDPGDARILIRPDYAPGVVADEPYAYIEFGERGAHVPIVLVPTHTALDGPVSVQSAEVSGIDQDIGMRLWQLGAGEVDIAASAWSGLLQDAGLAGETAGSILEEARRKAEELKMSVKVVPGVDSKIGSALEEKGIDSAVKLANADPGRLQEELGIDPLAANVVVEEARKIVPEEAWSLRSRDLGLSDKQLKALEEIGVTTKAALVEKPAEEIAEKAGVAADEAGSIKEKASEAIDEGRIKVSVREKAPVTVLKDVEDVQLDAGLAKDLAQSGIKSVKDVAETDADRLAALTGDRKLAQNLIDAAKARIGLLR